MKRFTSFLCALMLIALSASAMSNDTRTFELQRRQTILREAMIRNNGHLPFVAKAPQQKQEIYNLTIEDKPYVSSNSWGDPQVYISMTSEENYGITIYINGILEMENGKTYTYADMDSWSSVGNYNTYQYSGLSDAAITWSTDEEGYERFEGFVADTLGNTYNFLYQEVPFVPTGDTIKVRFSQVGRFEYSTWSNYWSINGNDVYGSGNPYNVYFSLNIENQESPAGHFTEADFNADGGNHIYISREDAPSKDRKFLEAKIDIIERNDSTLLYAYALAEDGNVYDIFIYYADPKPIYHESIVANMTVDKSYIEWSQVSFKAANEDYEFNLTIYNSDYYGTHQYPDAYPSVQDLKNQKYLNVFSGEFTITAGENGDILTGKFLCWNDTEYEIYLTEGAPTKTREENIVITENVGLYTFEDPNKIIFWGCNADSSRVVSISILTDNVDGTYTIDDIEASNTYIAYDMNQMGYVQDMFRVLDANLVVSTNAETGATILTGTVLAQSNYHFADVPEFTIVLKAEPAHPHLDYDTDNADFEAEYLDYEITASDPTVGGFLINAQNETSMAALVFYVAPGTDKLAAGTYTCTYKEGIEMSVKAGSCDGQNVYASFFMDFNYNIWFPFAGQATIDGDGVIVFDALNSYDRTIHVTLYPKQETAVENAKAESNAAKRIENATLIIEKNGMKYNVLGTVIK